MRGAGGQGRKVLEMVLVRGPTIPSDWPGWDYENLGQKKRWQHPPSRPWMKAEYSWMPSGSGFPTFFI